MRRLLFLLVGLGALLPAQAVSQEGARIAGLVLDAQDARIVGATVTVQSKGFKQEMTTGDEGEFDVVVPARITTPFYITVKIKNFCTFESGPLRVTSKRTELVNVHMEVASSHGACRCSGLQSKSKN